MMTVYVESNFVLELVFKQEQYQNCQKILSLCEAGKVNLVLPAFCIAESYDAFIRKSKARDALRKKLGEEFEQLSRGTLPKNQIAILKEVIELLLRTNKEEKQRLHKILERILKVSKLIPMISEILTLSATFWEPLELSLQDSIVYASVVHHLNTHNATLKCFLNRNSKDFNQLDIQETLTRHNCKLLFSFETGYNYIQSQVRSMHKITSTMSHQT